MIGRRSRVFFPHNTMPGSGAQWLRGPGGGRLAVRGVPPATSFAPTLRLARASAASTTTTHSYHSFPRPLAHLQSSGQEDDQVSCAVRGCVAVVQPECDPGRQRRHHPRRRPQHHEHPVLVRDNTATLLHIGIYV